jgi:hypothetical protein
MRVMIAEPVTTDLIPSTAMLICFLDLSDALHLFAYLEYNLASFGRRAYRCGGCGESECLARIIFGAR